MKIFAQYIDPNGIENKNVLKYMCPNDFKNGEIFIIDVQMVSKQDDTNLKLVLLNHFGSNYQKLGLHVTDLNPRSTQTF